MNMKVLQKPTVKRVFVSIREQGKSEVNGVVQPKPPSQQPKFIRKRKESDRCKTPDQPVIKCERNSATKFVYHRSLSPYVPKKENSHCVLYVPNGEEEMISVSVIEKDDGFCLPYEFPVRGSGTAVLGKSLIVERRIEKSLDEIMKVGTDEKEVDEGRREERKGGMCWMEGERVDRKNVEIRGKNDSIERSVEDRRSVEIRGRNGSSEKSLEIRNSVEVVEEVCVRNEIFEKKEEIKRNFGVSPKIERTEKNRKCLGFSTKLENPENKRSKGNSADIEDTEKAKKNFGFSPKFENPEKKRPKGSSADIEDAEKSKKNFGFSPKTETSEKTRKSLNFIPNLENTEKKRHKDKTPEDDSQIPEKTEPSDPEKNCKRTKRASIRKLGKNIDLTKKVLTKAQLLIGQPDREKRESVSSNAHHDENTTIASRTPSPNIPQRNRCQTLSKNFKISKQGFVNEVEKQTRGSSVEKEVENEAPWVSILKDLENVVQIKDLPTYQNLSNPRSSLKLRRG